ncbi:hypothetical protein ACE6H2_004967 [Prunus campanulata]
MGQGQSDGNAGNSNSNDMKTRGVAMSDNSGYTKGFTSSGNRSDNGGMCLDTIRPEDIDSKGNKGNFQAKVRTLIG